MPNVTVDLSPQALAALRLDPDSFVREMRIAAAIHWYQRGQVSQAAAAAVAGMSRLQFLDLLAARQVDVFVVDPDDLRAEVARG